MCFRLHTHGVKFDMSALNCQPLQRLAHYCSLVVTAAAAARTRFCRYLSYSIDYDIAVNAKHALDGPETPRS